jgi:hypothetical protein
MKKSGLLIFLIFGLLAGVFAQTDDEKKLLINKIQINDDKLELFIKKGMTDSIAELFSPNCHFANEFGTILESRESVKNFYVNDKKSGRKYIDYSLDVIEHKVYDEVILEVGTNTVKYSIGADKRLYTTQYNYMLVWKKSKNDDFQIRAAMWNLIKNPCAQ